MLLEIELLSIDKSNHVKRISLYLAALKDNLDVIIKLIDYEIDINVKDR